MHAVPHLQFTQYEVLLVGMGDSLVSTRTAWTSSGLTCIAEGYLWLKQMLL